MLQHIYEDTIITEEWLDFIINSRREKNIWIKNDISDILEGDN